MGETSVFVETPILVLNRFLSSLFSLYFVVKHLFLIIHVPPTVFISLHVDYAHASKISIRIFQGDRDLLNRGSSCAARIQTVPSGELGIPALTFFVVFVFVSHLFFLV